MVSLLLRLGLLGALQPDDEGDSEGKLLRSIDDTLCDVIATHDTTEDVDEDTLDLGVRDKDLERLLDRVGGGTSAAELSVLCFPGASEAYVPSDIKEVGGVPAVKSKDIHSRHSKASAVHEAPNAAIELDEVEVVLLRLDL